MVLCDHIFPHLETFGSKSSFSNLVASDGCYWRLYHLQSIDTDGAFWDYTNRSGVCSVDATLPKRLKTLKHLAITRQCEMRDVTDAVSELEDNRQKWWDFEWSGGMLLLLNYV